MNMSIEKMLSHVYEIEGLMLVSRRLGEENTPDVITNKLHRKVRELAEMCGMEMAVKQETPSQPAEQAAAQPAAQPVTVEEPAAVEEPVTVEEPAVVEAEGLPEEDYDADETWQHDNGEEFKEVFELNYEEPQHEQADDHEVPVADREPDDDITVEFIEADEEVDVEADEAPVAAAPQQAPHTPVPPVFNPKPEAKVETVVDPVAPAPLAVNDEPVPEPDPNVLPEAEDEPDITVEFIEADDVPIPEPEDLPIPPTPTEIPVEPEPQMPLRVDEKLQRHLSKDIRKALSINDRFRFQRELFAGSADALNTAIEHIEAMRSYGNAELYFYSQLNWDRENEVVKDFMTLVRNHFQK